MRRLLVVLAVVAVLSAGLVAAIVIHRLQSEPDIRGSSTEEFSLPTTTAPRPSSTPQIQWPQYGFDGEHPRSVSLGRAPPASAPPPPPPAVPSHLVVRGRQPRRVPPGNRLRASLLLHELRQVRR